jgi:hypothetical protein
MAYAWKRNEGDHFSLVEIKTVFFQIDLFMPKKLFVSRKRNTRCVYNGNKPRQDSSEEQKIKQRKLVWMLKQLNKCSVLCSALLFSFIYTNINKATSKKKETDTREYIFGVCVCFCKE